MRALWRLIKRAAIATMGVSAAAAVAAWKFSDLFRDDALLPPAATEDPEYADAIVIRASDDRITLQPQAGGRPEPTTDGRFGITWDGGHGRIGEIIVSRSHEVERHFTPVAGMPEPGDRVATDGTYFYRDPAADHGIAFDEVEFASVIGELGAWFVQGTSETWAIVTHGKGVDRREGLRMLPALVEAGLPTLLISYRNDIGAPVDASGRYQFGLTEWRDLEGAAEWALDNGAKRLVLVGFSMGGAITMEFMHDSRHAHQVAGLILDSPMLDFSRTVDRGAAQLGVPRVLNSLAKQVAAVRFDIDWEAMDYLDKAHCVSVPVLLFHGTADLRVPVELSEELASLRPDHVEFVKVEGAGHVESWNVAPEAYMSAVSGFVGDLR